MKNLLNKTVKPFTVYTLIVLLTSIPAYFFLVDGIWLHELDEHNEIISEKTENHLRKLALTDSQISQSIYLWNKIQPGTTLEPLSSFNPKTRVYTVTKKNPYSMDVDRFRGLSKTIFINDKPYLLTVETNVEETEETMFGIALITMFFFFILIIGFVILNRRLSIRLWEPFRRNLKKLQSFDLHSQSPLTFEKSDTIEFEELNAALEKLIQQNIRVYQTQKEFTENASHELQTPLAIVKNKMALLLQNESVTDRQYSLIEDINRAITRMSRINKNLLLLAKIEHDQFMDKEKLNISQLITTCWEELKEHSDIKNLSVQSSIGHEVYIFGNKVLAELLINNLLLNAIRHSEINGSITISLDNKHFFVANSGHKALNPTLLFERFSKLSENKSGSGLGLAIVREICKQYDWALNYTYEDQSHRFSVNF